MVKAILDFLFAWLGGTPLHDFMINVKPAFATAETLHFIGLSLLFGALLVVDLRGMGFMKRIPFEAAHKLIPFAIAGFIINLLTGIAFIAYDPANYTPNHYFQWKMISIFLAGVNVVVFEVFVHLPMLKGVPMEGKAITRATCALSLILWSLVLIFGRLLPFN